MKKTLITLLLTFVMITPLRAQINDPAQLISRFYNEVFVKNTAADKIALDYIEYSDTSMFKMATNAISDLRTLASKEAHFGHLKEGIVNNTKTITSFQSFSEKEKNMMSHLAIEDRKNLYKLEAAGAQPTFVWLKGNKIRSFFGFQKPGDNYRFLAFVNRR